MNAVLTLQQRKQARIDEIRAGFAVLRTQLVEYGHAHGGKFWVFGSAASGQFHFDSDIDILVDFDDQHLVSALDFVEDACRRLGLKADIQPKSWCVPAFVERIATKAVVLP